jgi:hypothetical protein
MATRTSKRKVTLQICIDELTLIQSLSEDSRNHPLLKPLVAFAKEDVLDALSKISKGDDLPEEKNAPPKG